MHITVAIRFNQIGGQIEASISPCQVNLRWTTHAAVAIESL
jgi:hypothetical protein